MRHPSWASEFAWNRFSSTFPDFPFCLRVRWNGARETMEGSRYLLMLLVWKRAVHIHHQERRNRQQHRNDKSEHQPNFLRPTDRDPASIQFWKGKQSTRFVCVCTYWINNFPSFIWLLTKLPSDDEGRIKGCSGRAQIGNFIMVISGDRGEGSGMWFQSSKSFSLTWSPRGIEAGQGLISRGGNDFSVSLRSSVCLIKCYSSNLILLESIRIFLFVVSSNPSRISKQTENR